MDAVAARRAGFPQPVAHGFLLGAHVSRLVGMELPGATALLLSETLRFHRPVFAGETLRVQGVVESRSESTRTIDLAIRMTSANALVVSGHVRVKVTE
jgi:acyl dehydratase